ncbi:MAG: hypothetical protein M0D55_15940 [Elusimicrobiota bacterium]|nr:MAG: hypothetical protein M0D55_15940 [Elusimicrobiota bacterium]
MNEKVSFLQRKDCHAKTGGFRTIEGAVEDAPGTTLEDFHCAAAEGGDEVVLGIDVKEYRKLAVSPLPEKRIPKGLDARIRRSVEFRRLVTEHEPAYDFSETLKLSLHEVAQSTRTTKTYVATYKSDAIEDQFVFLVNDGRIDAITKDEPGCVGPPEAFRLNGADFLRFNVCACGTDGCERNYVQISKK